MAFLPKFIKNFTPVGYSSLPALGKSKRSAIAGYLPADSIAKTYTLKSPFKPATLGLIIQAIALLLVLGLSHGLQALSFRNVGVLPDLSLLHLVLAQSIFAMLLTMMLGMERWWRWIHAGFPLAGWALAQWPIPSELYLAAFLISLSLYWTTFRTQVPFFPSRPSVWQHVVKLMPTDRPVHLIDIGSGVGDMVMHAAKSGMTISANSKFTGIEIAVLPWLISVVRARLKRSAAVFRLGDYNRLDFTHYDIVFAYLSPAAMTKLWEKASREMRPGSLLISYEFEIPGMTPDMLIPGVDGAPCLYAWNMGSRVC